LAWPALVIGLLGLLKIAQTSVHDLDYHLFETVRMNKTANLMHFSSPMMIWDSATRFGLCPELLWRFARVPLESPTEMAGIFIPQKVCYFLDGRAGV
jgi:hypothetical protein